MDRELGVPGRSRWAGRVGVLRRAGGWPISSVLARPRVPGIRSGGGESSGVGEAGNGIGVYQGNGPRRVVAKTAAQMDEYWMRRALQEAAVALAEGEVPVGAVLVRDGRCVAAEHNRKEQRGDPAGHAELLLLQRMGRQRGPGGWRLTSYTLYVTLEPCPMCAAALMFSRVARVVFGAPDPLRGAAGTVYQLLGDGRLGRPPLVQGNVLKDEATALMREFFAQVRQQQQRQ